MAKKNKTTVTDKDVLNFLEEYVDQEQKKAESIQLIELMRDWSGFEPKMWGPTIIGFGSYHYTYASGHEGDAPLIGFSPRKAEFSLYVFTPTDKNKHLLEGLGKYKMGKACMYVKKLADIDLKVLQELCKTTIAYLNEHHECACHTN